MTKLKNSIDFVELDNDIPTHGELTDKEICEHVSNNIGNIDDDDDDDDDSDEGENELEEEKLTWAEGLDALRKFQWFLQENYEGFDRLALAQLEEMVERDAIKRQRQSSILDYFCK